MSTFFYHTQQEMAFVFMFRSTCADINLFKHLPSEFFYFLCLIFRFYTSCDLALLLWLYRKDFDLADGAAHGEEQKHFHNAPQTNTH